MVVNIARKTIFCAVVHYQEGKITADICKMGMYYTIFLYNQIPRMDKGLSSY